VLRERSATDITSIGFPGYAIGGLSVGESKTDMHRVTGLTARLLPEASPRYLMGVGSPEDLVECVARGVDMFDCVLPTRIARNGALLVGTGRLNVDTAPFRTMEQPVEPGCDCYTCANFSAAYLHHLFRAKEVLAFRLATIHNLRFVIRLMSDMRQAIVDGEFEAFRASFHRRFVPPDEATRRGQKQKWLDSRERSRAPIPQARR
jgi:queuine tRNA-ribosyltransferase